MRRRLGADGVGSAVPPPGAAWVMSLGQEGLGSTVPLRQCLLNLSGVGTWGWQHLPCHHPRGCDGAFLGCMPRDWWPGAWWGGLHRSSEDGPAWWLPSSWASGWDCGSGAGQSPQCPGHLAPLRESSGSARPSFSRGGAVLTLWAGATTGIRMSWGFRGTSSLGVPAAEPGWMTGVPRVQGLGEGRSVLWTQFLLTI